MSSLGFIAVAIGAVGSAQAALATERQGCGALPESTLQIYDIKTPALDERIVTEATLESSRDPSPISSFHTGMLTTHDVVVFVEVSHRIVSSTSRLFCDAPAVVRIGLGFSHRIGYFPRSAAQDQCARDAMRSHEAIHNSADEGALDRFLDNERDRLAEAMRRLKQAPAPSPDDAIARWKAGLQAILTEVKLRFLAEEQRATAEVDTTTALQQLANACDGKLKARDAEARHPL